VVYDYVDIRKDNIGRLRVKEINAGYESVPTLVFADGSTLTEPSREMLRGRLESLNSGLTPLSTADRLLIRLHNPIISAFGVGLLIGGRLSSSLPIIGLGVFLLLLPLLVRFARV
jgi:hypothetical protein